LQKKQARSANFSQHKTLKIAAYLTLYKMVTKSEIEEAIRGKDDFVKIDHLKRMLKNADNIEVKKFILLNLAGTAEQKGLFSEAIKNIVSASEIVITFREKIELFMKESELWIKSGDFNMADKALQKALAISGMQERSILQSRYWEMYRAYAKAYEDTGKARKAVAVYERILSMKQGEKDSLEIKRKLADLYEKVGRIYDASAMRRAL